MGSGIKYFSKKSIYFFASEKKSLEENYFINPNPDSAKWCHVLMAKIREFECIKFFFRDKTPDQFLTP